jgi:hypothetical protein
MSASDIPSDDYQVYRMEAPKVRGAPGQPATIVVTPPLIVPPSM